jgi:hypothetical protein
MLDVRRLTVTPRAQSLVGLVLAAVLSVVPSRAVTQSQGLPAPPEFVRSFGDAGFDILAVNLDEFAVELAHRPTSFGEIVVLRGYGQPPGFTHRHLRTLRNYLVWHKNVSSDRLVLVNGGSAVCANVRLRVSDVRPVAPQVDNWATDPDLWSDETRLYDSYAIYDESSELVPSEFSTDPTLLDDLASYLRRDKSQRVVLIGYASAGTSSTSRKARVLELLRERKRFLTSKHAIASRRVETLFGGYRSGCELEIYVVPPTGMPPRATPTRRPPVSRRSRR